MNFSFISGSRTVVKINGIRVKAIWESEVLTNRERAEELFRRIKIYCE